MSTALDVMYNTKALDQILLTHAHHYPLMEPRDAVKLIYQNEFGGGHLIRDEAACVVYLQREYGSVAQSADVPLTEDIGNGLVRVNLAALDAHAYPPEALAADFIRSAADHTGNLESFLAKLAVLRQLTRDGHFGFSPEVLENYLCSYAEAGYPMVSHSEAYRSAYGPAYRIVLKKYLNTSNNA